MNEYEWATRKPDNSFETLANFQQDAIARKQFSAEDKLQLGALQVVTTDDRRDIRLEGVGRNPHTFTPWSFQQLCQLVKAPAAYLREMPAPLLAENLNEGLATYWPKKIKVLRDISLKPTVRAINGPRYSRLADAHIAPWIWETMQMVPGWQMNTLKTSDRATHLTLVHDDLVLRTGSEELHRGLMVSNSEVGAAAFVVSIFWFRWACTNGLIFGRKNIGEVRVRHIGDARDRAFNQLEAILDQALHGGWSEDQQAIDHAIRTKVASNEDEAVAWLLGKGLTKDLARQVVINADKEEGQAGNVWSLVQGLTATARELPNMDDRVRLEREAGRLLLAA